MNGTHATPTEVSDAAGFNAWLSAGAAASPVAGRTSADWQRINDSRTPLTEAERYALAIRLATTAPGLSLAHISPDPDGECLAALGRAFGGEKPDPTIWADRIEWADGGDVIRLKRRPMPSSAAPGGVRGNVGAFSYASRQRLLVFINSIDRRQVDPGRLWFVTLTYPGLYPKSPEIWKRHLQALQKRLRRAFGQIPAIWKLEPQHRGAPHFHLIMLMPPSFCRGLRVVRKRTIGKRRKTYWAGGELASFRQWLSRAWYEVVDSGDERHLRAGTNCEPLEAWGKVIAYASKYIGKDCVFVTDEGETQSVGRYWGVWHRDGFPIAWKSKVIPRSRWALVRRTVRRMLKHCRVSSLCGRDRSSTVFLKGESIERLLAWAGIGLPQAFPTTRAAMGAAGYAGTINEWLDTGEDERQRLHRARRGMPPHLWPQSIIWN